MECQIGDNVIVKTKVQTYEGLLLPSVSKGFTTIKLTNGYNLGIKDSEVISKESIHNETKEKPTELPKEKIQESSSLPIISILHTGGTFASKVDYKTGGVSAKFSPEDLIKMFPELKGLANVRSRLIRNMMSEDMNFNHYNLIATEVKKEIENGSQAVIVTHGTDTLHYTSCALSFVLDGLKTPVILVGSQRSSDRGSSDAYLNLLSAALFVTKSDFAGVAICMHKNTDDTKCSIMPGCKARKMHTSKRDAFKPINSSEIAVVDFERKEVEFIIKDHQKRQENVVPKVMLFKSGIRVGIIKARPGLTSEEILFYKGFNGLIIEGTGLGHFPNTEIDEFTKENKKVFMAVEYLCSRGVLVALSPQTIYGRLQMNVYSPQRRIREIGVLGHDSDMTTEASFIKATWLLSNYDIDEAKKLFSKNLRGELSKRSQADWN